MASGFRMEVLGYDPEPRDLPDITYADLSEVYGRSDFLALCCPLNEATRHLLGRSALAELKPGVFVINTGRGAVIDSGALYEALEAGKVGGAGLDVLEMEHLLRPGAREPQDGGEAEIVALNKRLMSHPRVVVTPHMAFYTREAVQRIREVTVKSITSFLAGSPTNVVHA
jgi:D-lactate dehydrogenase